MKELEVWSMPYGNVNVTRGGKLEAQFFGDDAIKNARRYVRWDAPNDEETAKAVAIITRNLEGRG